MKVLNIHERCVDSSSAEMGAMLDTLATADDRLWPHERWPPMIFPHGLELDAEGGHGPVRYTISHYERGQKVVFRFTGPAGFHGYHFFEVLPGEGRGCLIRHTIEMKIKGAALFSWPLVFRPLHDALIEDAFDKAESAFSGTIPPRRWSLWVTILRRLLKRKK